MPPSQPVPADPIVHRPAAVARALEIFSDSWSFAVLQELFYGVRRFDDFQKNLCISRSVLSRRLRHLVAQGIISRTVYQQRPERSEYRLTPSGRDMYAIFILLRDWGERWIDGAGEGDPVLIHLPCEQELAPVLICSHCQRPIDAHDVAHRERSPGG